jgi:hypothetical protein
MCNEQVRAEFGVISRSLNSSRISARPDGKSKRSGRLSRHSFMWAAGNVLERKCSH